MRRASRLILILATWTAGAGRVHSSIPRSTSGCSASTTHHHSIHPDPTNTFAHDNNDIDSHRPAWNVSPKINDQGYLCEIFRRIPGEWESSASAAAETSGNSKKSHSLNNINNLNTPVVIRQVPGDGCCLFHAVAISLNLIRDGRHLRMDNAESLRELKAMSRSLRHAAVDCLRSCGVKEQQRNKNSTNSSLFIRRKGRAVSPHTIHTNTQKHHTRLKKKYPRLFIQGNESMETSQLLSTAATQYGISPVEYCDLMEQDSYWGGGPEIVALCNVLKRPIHVYELVADSERDAATTESTSSSSTCAVRVPDHLINQQFCLRRMATFGSPKYDGNTPLHILSADSRFPDVPPECILENGNHFMALFPVDIMSKWAISSSLANRNDSGASLESDRKQRLRGGGTAVVLSSREEAQENKYWLCNNPEWHNDFSYSVVHNGTSEWICQPRGWYQRITAQHRIAFQEKVLKFGITLYDRAISRVGGISTVLTS